MRRRSNWADIPYSDGSTPIHMCLHFEDAILYLVELNELCRIFLLINSHDIFSLGCTDYWQNAEHNCRINLVDQHRFMDKLDPGRTIARNLMGLSFHNISFAF